jgi:hypothetical protein
MIPMAIMSNATNGFRLFLAWLLLASTCVGVWYLLLFFVLYPYAESIGSGFRVAVFQ